MAHPSQAANSGNPGGPQLEARALRFGAAALVDVPLDQFAQRAGLIEDLGFDHLWIPDERLLRNVYASLTIAATKTDRIRLGTAVTNPYTRHPAITAAAIASIDELSGGRTALGLGAGGALEPYGIHRDNPVGRLREMTSVVRALTRGDVVSYEGRWCSLSNASMDFAPVRQIPIYIAGRGRNILQLAGEIADGVIIGGFAEEAGLRYARAQVQRGLDASGRGWDALEAIVWIFISISPQRDAARKAVSQQVLAALIGSRPILDELGVELPQPLRLELEASGWTYPHDATKAARLLTDSILDAFAVYGTPDDCASKLAALDYSDIDQVGFVTVPPDGSNVEEVTYHLANEVLPALRSSLA